jgi:hypothetical protein
MRAITQGKESPHYQKDASSANNEQSTISPEKNMDFSMKLMHCLNQASGNSRLDSMKSGPIKVSITLNRNNNVFNGQDVDGNTSYVLKNLKLNYCSVPTQPSKIPTVMRVKYTYKTNIDSSFTNIHTKVPAVCSGVSLSFQPSLEEGVRQLNNTQLSQLPNVEELIFSFSDATNSLISYSIKDDEEVLDRYIESMGDGEDNSVNRNNVISNKVFGVGLSFRDRIDLSNQRFSTQITSAIQSSNPVVAYLYFHSSMSM